MSDPNQMVAGQHLKNLLDRLGKSAAALVNWEFFTINGQRSSTSDSHRLALATG